MGDTTAVLVEPDDTAARIRAECRDWAALMPDDYDPAAGEPPLTVLCYVVAEAYYFAQDKPDALTPERRSHDDGSHWYLRRDDDAVLDLSLRADREYAREWFDAGQPSGFLSHPNPSNRTAKVLDRLGVAY
jgi:hypothetical protein